MNYVYKETELHNLKGEEKEAYIDFAKLIHDTYFFKEISRSREHIAKEMDTRSPKTRYENRILVWDKNKVIGKAEFMYSRGEQETNSDMCEIFMEIHPNYTKQGVATEMMRKLVDMADTHRKTKLEMWANNYTLDGVVPQIIQKIGLKPALEEKLNRLMRSNINYDFLNQKLPLLQEKLKGYTLLKLTRHEYQSKLLNDEAFRTEMADFTTEVMALIPKEDSDRHIEIYTSQDMLEKATTAISRPYDGNMFILFDKNTIMGYSETFYPKGDIRSVNTGLTGVRKRYQRMGIATFLKLLMVKHYLDSEEFQQLDTENNQANVGMIKINEDIGFRHALTWICHEGSLESVRNYLQSKPN